MNRIERGVAAILFGSRWLVAPFLLGLIIGIAAMVYKFVTKLFEFILRLPTALLSDVLVGILTLVELILTASLVILVICASYENFVAPVDTADHSRRPGGLMKVGFADLKQKLLGIIVAIAAVNVLEWFMDINEHVDNAKLAWGVGILLAFAAAMLILAVADRMSATSDHESH